MNKFIRFEEFARNENNIVRATFDHFTEQLMARKDIEGAEHTTVTEK